MGNHISAYRRDSAQKKIEVKINVLEHYVAKGIPEGAFVPKDLTSFRRWEDNAFNVEKIGSPNTLDRPYNKKLKKRALELINELAKRNRRKNGRMKIVDNLRAQVKRFTDLTRSLTSQLHSTRHDLEHARQSHRRLESRLKEVDEENSELRRTLSTVTGLKLISGNTEETNHASQ